MFGVDGMLGVGCWVLGVDGVLGVECWVLDVDGSFNFAG